MIIVAGSPSEPPVELLLNEARAAELEVVLLAEEDAADWQLEVGVCNGKLHAYATPAGQRVDLSSATGLYLRLTAPTVTGLTPDPLQRARHQAAISLLSGWADVAPIRVANRPAAMAGNGSKPYQTALIRDFGFGVPETLVTSDPQEVLRFRQRHGRVIYKSTSGVRSIVHELTDERLADLDRIKVLPTQFQRLLSGTNVRVHVVGEDVHACVVETQTIDYRYVTVGTSVNMEAITLPEEISQRCVALAKALDLPLAGVDLMHDPDGQWWCFEVNPSPAYSAFEQPTGLPIAHSLARWLAGATDTQT